MQIKFAKKFSKQYDKANSKIKSAFNKKLTLFNQDPHNAQLNNHALLGKLLGLRSINVTGDWRALYSEHIIFIEEKLEKIIIFEILGTHSQIYK